MENFFFQIFVFQMGREGGGDLKTFPTKEEAEKYVLNKQKKNEDAVAKYEGDNTDTGRGDACREGGGFSRVRVVRSLGNLLRNLSNFNSTAIETFSSFEQAKKVLSEKAEDADLGDDSIAYVVGTYQVLSPEIETQKKEETKAFIDEMHDLMKVPQGEAFFNLGSDNNFVKCSGCHSQCSLTHLKKKQRHASSDRWGEAIYVGVCPVCDSDAPFDKKNVVITTDEWNSLTGRQFTETGNSLKRPRTLFNQDHAKQCDERFNRGKVQKESFKKRKADLDSNTTGSAINAMVVSCWTSAHF